MKDVLATRPVSQQMLLITALLLSLSVLPHWWNLPPLVTGAFFLLLLLRPLLWREPSRIPGPWIRLPLVVLGVVVVIQQAGLTEGRQFGVALLVIMSGLKLLELKSHRDLFMAVFLGLFLLTTLFLFSQNALLTFYVLLLILAYTTVLVLANRTGPELPLKQAVRTALVLTLGGIPVMVLLFALFPRLDGPLWSLSLGRGQGITGMSDNISMGSISSLSQSEETAFRVRFDGTPPPPQEHYWRGMVLWHTDGRRWTRVKSSAAKPATEGLAGTAAYEVTMEPSDQPWLFPLDRVREAQGDLLLSEDGELATRHSIRRRFTYRAESAPPPLTRPLTGRERRLGLQLPARLSPRVRRLAHQWRQAAASDAQVVEQALRHFNTQPFVYTLQPPLLGDDPVDGFLFDTRKGFCEHYATSFVLLMRLAGIPARVVIGYQGGEINPLGGHLLVRQSDAHAWAEVWLREKAGRGWIPPPPWPRNGWNGESRPNRRKPGHRQCFASRFPPAAWPASSATCNGTATTCSSCGTTGWWATTSRASRTCCRNWASAGSTATSSASSPWPAPSPSLPCSSFSSACGGPPRRPGARHLEPFPAQAETGRPGGSPHPGSAGSRLRRHAPLSPPGTGHPRHRRSLHRAAIRGRIHSGGGFAVAPRSAPTEAPQGRIVNCQSQSGCSFEKIGAFVVNRSVHR